MLGVLLRRARQCLGEEESVCQAARLQLCASHGTLVADACMLVATGCKVDVSHARQVSFVQATSVRRLVEGVVFFWE